MRPAQRVLLWVAVLVLAVIVFAALWPGVLATHDPLQTAVRSALLPPSAEHLFGTDQSGRDVYSRVIYGAGRSLGIGLLATGVALVVGLVIGALAGVAPKGIDTTVMRVNDRADAFPEFPRRAGRGRGPGSGAGEHRRSR